MSEAKTYLVWIFQKHYIEGDKERVREVEVLADEYDEAAIKLDDIISPLDDFNEYVLLKVVECIDRIAHNESLLKVHTGIAKSLLELVKGLNTKADGDTT